MRSSAGFLIAVMEIAICAAMAGCAGREIESYDDRLADVSLPVPLPAPRSGPDVANGTVTAPSRPAHEKLTESARKKQISDDRLRTEILAAIVDDPAVDPFQFRFVVRDGNVEVRGEGSDRQKRRVEKTVSRVRGVRGVENEVLTEDQLRSAEVFPVSDEQIERDLLERIERDPMADFSRVKIVAQEGAVTLQGTVPNLKTEREIERLAKDLRGVRSVTNRLVVRPRYIRDDRRLVRDIHAAIGLEPLLRDEKIDAQARAGIVDLSGEVSSAWKKERAEDLGSQVFGVRGIRNAIQVAPPAEPAR